jgi:hypothetical protein
MNFTIIITNFYGTFERELWLYMDAYPVACKHGQRVEINAKVRGRLFGKQTINV